MRRLALAFTHLIESLRSQLFTDTPRGTTTNATCYSLIETAKANGLEPHDYLHRVLQHSTADDTVEKLEALLP